MKWLLQTYTSRYNRRHRYFGHLFSGRFKAPIVDGSGDGYLRTVCEYVHLNPVRAHLLPDEEPLRAYTWSSYPLYLVEHRPRWLRVDRVLGECGIVGDTPAGRQQFERVMEQRRFQADGRDYKHVRRGWCVGSEQFREELLAQVSRQIGPNHFGQERRESAEQVAARIISEELAELGITLPQLQLRPGCGGAKFRLARRLRRETTMSLAWIAKQLGIGSSPAQRSVHAGAQKAISYQFSSVNPRWHFAFSSVWRILAQLLRRYTHVIFPVDIYRTSMYRASMVTKDLVAASSKPLILSILAGGESYGYEITRKVRELSGGGLEWTDGMLYPVLHRLERQGLVVSEWKQSDTGRERKYYRLSAKGRESMQTERRQWFTVHNTLCKLWKIKTVSI